MKNITIFSFLLILFAFHNHAFAETKLDSYMKEFYENNIKAYQILKEIEIDLKSGEKSLSCNRQKEAAKLGLSANDSLLKAFEISDQEPPMETIERSRLKWQMIYESC